MDAVYWARPAKKLLPKDLSTFYSSAAELIGRNQPIDYFEFGVAHGKSMREMTRIFPSPDARFHGFDSFTGLPEKWLMHDVGAFSNLGRFPEIGDSRVTFVKGWFQNTVPGFLANFKPQSDRPIFIHFDADLYSSTLFLLATLWAHVDNYYFLMDDFIHDEVIAVRDFAVSFPVEFEFIAQTIGGGERPNPDQVFGHMKRVPFTLDGVE
jgi:hypothetical protein